LDIMSATPSPAPGSPAPLVSQLANLSLTTDSSADAASDGRLVSPVPTAADASASSPEQVSANKQPDSKIFVGGLPYTTTAERLSEYFAKFGEIEEAVVIMDRATGRSRGYGFVRDERMFIRV
jgi:hypothetical protein